MYGRGNNHNNSSSHSPYSSPQHFQDVSFRPRFHSSPPFRANFSPFGGSPNRSPWTPSGNRPYGHSPGGFTSTPRHQKTWSSNDSYSQRSIVYSSPEGYSPAGYSPNRSRNSSRHSMQSPASTRIEDYIDASMLEDPWAELEKQILTANRKETSS